MSVSRLATFAILAALLLPGIIGHDPWKPDEAYTFGLVWEILRDHQWLVPTLAGEPFMEKPPLYFVAAALSSELWSPWLAPHDGARFATLAFMALAVWATGRAARTLFGPGHGGLAALLLAATLGLVPHAHEMITDSALLAGAALAVLGFARAARTPGEGGAFLAAGLVVGFMSKGLLLPGVLAVAFAALACLPSWRKKSHGLALLRAMLFAAPFILPWPASLFLSHPDLFREWLFTQNFGRFLGTVRAGPAADPWSYLAMLPWWSLPTGLCAAWSLRVQGPRERQAVLMLAVVSGATMAVLLAARTTRDLYALPLLPPLAVMGSLAVTRMPAAGARALEVAAAMIATAVLAVSWGAWAESTLDGRIGAPLRFLGRWLPLDYAMPWRAALVAGAVLLVLLWLWVHRPRAEGITWLHRWGASIAMAWGLPMTLLLPWIDHAKSFREPFAELAGRIERGSCVTRVNLGEPQRAMLHYMADILTLPEGQAECPYRIVQTTAHGAWPARSAAWQVAWESSRPGERLERFQLWTRGDAPRVASGSAGVVAGTHRREGRGG